MLNIFTDPRDYIAVGIFFLYMTIVLLLWYLRANYDLEFQVFRVKNGVKKPLTQKISLNYEQPLDDEEDSFEAYLSSQFK